MVFTTFAIGANLNLRKFLQNLEMMEFVFKKFLTVFADIVDPIFDLSFYPSAWLNKACSPISFQAEICNTVNFTDAWNRFLVTF